MALKPGDRIAERYEIIRRLREDSTVYQVRDSSTGAEAALCWLPVQPSATLTREVGVLTGLAHGALARMLDHGESDGDPFVVTHFVAGVNLWDELDQWALHTGRGLPWDKVVADALVALDALAYLHGAGIVHRAVKPSHLVRGSDGHLKLVGLLPPCCPDALPAGYVAPEQMAGNPEPRSDLYSLGATLHCLLVGMLPEAGDLTLAMLPGLPDGLDEMVEKALEPRAEDRFPSAAAMADALRTL